MSIADYIYFFTFFVTSCILFWLVYKVIGNFISVKIISGYYLLQVFLVIIFLLYDKDIELINNDLPGIKLYDNYRRILFVYLLFQFSLVIAAFFFKSIFIGKHSSRLIDQVRNSGSAVLKVTLKVLALIFISYPFLGFIGPVGYVIRVFFNYFLFAPFLAGLYIKKSKSLSYFWGVAMLVLFIAGTISGGRSTAISTVVLYVIGVFFSNVVSKKSLVLWGGIFLIPLVGYMSLVSQVRRYTERKIEFSIDRIREIRKAYEKTKKLQGRLDEQELERQFLYHSVGRLYTWPNATLISIIPRQKEYRGFEGIVDVDLRYTFDLSFLTGTTKRDLVEAGYSTYILREYGFSFLNEFYSEDLGIIGEAWIRFGWLGVFAWGFIWSSILIFLEVVNLSLSNRLLTFKALFYAILLYISLKTYVYPMFGLTKLLFLGIILSFILLIIGTLILFIVKKEERTSL